MDSLKRLNVEVPKKNIYLVDKMYDEDNDFPNMSEQAKKALDKAVEEITIIEETPKIKEQPKAETVEVKKEETKTERKEEKKSSPTKERKLKNYDSIIKSLAIALINQSREAGVPLYDFDKAQIDLIYEYILKKLEDK